MRQAKRHEALRVQLLQRDLLSLCKPVPRRQHGHCTFPHDHLALDLGGVMRQTKETHVQAVLLQRLYLRGRRHFVQRPSYGRITLVERAQRKRNGVDHGRTDDAYLEVAYFPSPRATGQIDRPFELREHQGHLFLQCFPCLRELDTMLRAREKSRAQLLFKQPDLLAQRGLGNVQARGCAAEMQLVGKHREVTQQPDVHIAYVSRVTLKNIVQSASLEETANQAAVHISVTLDAGEGKALKIIALC